MRLAIIGPSFFGYLERLVGLFRARGIEADFFDERFTNNAWGKAFLRFSPQGLRDRAAAAHMQGIGDRILAGGFTHALLVSPEVVTPELVQRLRDGGLRVVRYGWDSLANKPRMARIDPLVHAIASFDPDDCAGRGYQLIPLYSDTVAPEAPPPPRETDILYCGTVHSRRPYWLRDVLRACDQFGWSYRMMLFYHGKGMWLVNYGWNASLWRLFPLIQTKAFGRDELVDQTLRARIVLDIHHTGQSGLTMRTFEALSLGALVITTNATGAATLVPRLRGRVVVIDGEDLAGAIQRAQQHLPLPPLDSTDRYELSVERFVDQLSDFIFGPKAPKFQEGIP